MRRFRWVGGLLTAVLLFLALPASLSAHAMTAASPYEKARALPYAAEPSPHGSLAGSRAGVGRTPPGRALPAPTAPDDALPPVPTQPPPAVPTEPPRPEPSDTARQAIGEPGAKPLVNVVPLGAGLLLTGLGLGFLALRLRR